MTVGAAESVLLILSCSLNAQAVRQRQRGVAGLLRGPPARSREAGLLPHPLGRPRGGWLRNRRGVLLGPGGGAGRAALQGARGGGVLPGGASKRGNIADQLGGWDSESMDGVMKAWAM